LIVKGEGEGKSKPKACKEGRRIIEEMPEGLWS